MNPPSLHRWRTACIGLGFAVMVVSALAQEPRGHAWEDRGGYRVARLPAAPPGQTGFTSLTPAATGITFSNYLPDIHSVSNLNVENGSGIALGDYDGDGLCDIYFCNLAGTNALYRNLGGWRFRDVTREAGVACPGQFSTGAVFADVNGDGALDLLVTSMGGPNACFLNDGHGRFTNVTAQAGLVSKWGASSMGLADMDGNGTLDLYVANYGLSSILHFGGQISVSYVNGKPVVRGRHAQRIKIIDGIMTEFGEPDTLWLNDGRGRFNAVPWTGGAFLQADGSKLAAEPWDQGLSVLVRDLNGDGRPDIYVCNDAYTPDRLWINQGGGRFQAAPPLALRHMSYFSMGADAADVDRDGHDDLFVLDMLSRQHRLRHTQKSPMRAEPVRPGVFDDQPQIRRNTLHHARGDGTYEEIANFAGLAASEWSWGAVFLDVDLDGWEDLLVSNGFTHDTDDVDSQPLFQNVGGRPAHEVRRTFQKFPRLDVPNAAFHNQRDLTFRETARDWGFDSTRISHGMALADLDNDGDLDVVINCFNAPPLIYRNNSPAPRLAVRLRGQGANTQGIGARVIVTGGPVTQSQEIVCGGRYVSGDDPMRVFATGTASQLAIEVRWPAGTRSFVPDALPGHIYEIRESGAGPGTPEKTPAVTPFFRDVSTNLNHTHHEELFDDFARQPLLPKRLSQLGPGVAWFDLDGDGRDELIVGSGRGGALAVYRHDGKGAFQPWLDTNWTAPATRDQTGLVGWTPRPGERALLVGLANYEDDSTNGWSVQMFVPGAKAPVGLPDVPASSGPLAVADYDGDGALDLFVGGRVVRGRWPEAASSQLFRNVKGKLEVDVENSARLKNVGLVSGAVWSDLDGDGLPELILACEWGPVRVYKNDAGRLREITRELGLAELTGWWTGVTAADLDGDGRMDLIAGNWGMNDEATATREEPALIFYDDFSGAGRIDFIEAYSVPGLGIAPRRRLGDLTAAMPFLREKFSSHLAFAGATVEQALGARFATARRLQAVTLATTVLLNRGNRFEPVPLPREAQFAPVFGLCVADFDGDGHEDVFLAQNFFGTRTEVPRLDAGRGLFLRGDGTGRLRPVRGQESGLLVYGEQRGAAAADYDGDGRVDLVVSQNGTGTKLFHNETARPGLRVRVDAGPGNPTGIGARLRLHSDAAAGPSREIHGGGGYWSQEGAVQVLAMPAAPAALVVHWPGGGSTTNALPAGARDIVVKRQGGVTVLP